MPTMGKVALAKRLAEMSEADRKETILFANELAGRTSTKKKKRALAPKQKRKRRTKAEMAAAKAEADKKGVDL